ncbi:FAD-dependent oxidoreductase [Pseudomonas sp. Q2-TVG4-2]|uniref:hydroxysqualene dehydroxylase n=1 Tax=Pseudomonas sp. Q2-TVG4-2 TaxID=1685699 RepID=UPI0015E6F93A|nr:FAD-dependent oxidoreductase [Pseudomonas sp. Q2-TVG4-2]
MANADAVIVGAGIAGLSCAARLAEAGLKVCVVEASDVPGGRARSWSDPVMGDSVDIGPHILLNKYANMRALLERLGTADQVLWQTEELLTVFDRGRSMHFKVGGLPAPLHYVRNLPRILPSVPLRHLLSNTRLAWQTLCNTGPELMRLDDRNGREHLERCGVSEFFIDWFWASASIAILAVPVERCSAAALMRLLGQALGHNDIVFGMPRVGLSDLYAWPAIEFIRRHGGEVRLGCPVNGLVRRDGRVRGVSLGNGNEIETGAVVLAVQPAAIEPLLPARHPLIQVAGLFQPSPYISCYLWFDRPITASRFWARPWRPDSFNTDFYNLSNIRPATKGGALIASNIIWSQRVEHLSDEAIIDATRREIAEFAPEAQRARLLSASVHRIPMAVPAAFPGTETVRPQTMVEPGLWLAGDWVDTGLPYCMESATRAGALAAEAVLAERGLYRQLALPPPRPRGLGRWLRSGEAGQDF